MNDTAEAGNWPYDLGVCLISALKEQTLKKKKKYARDLRNFHKLNFTCSWASALLAEFYLTAKCECSVY